MESFKGTPTIVAIALLSVLSSVILTHAKDPLENDVIVKTPEEAIDSILYYSDAGRELGKAITEAPLNAIMESRYDLGKSFMRKLKSLHNAGSFGSFSRHSDCKPVGKMKYFRGQCGYEGIDVVISSIIMRYNDRKIPIEMRVPFKLFECKHVVFALRSRLAPSDKSELGFKLSVPREAC